MSKSIFEVDAQEYGKTHGYVDRRSDLNPFVNPRVGYTLNTDLMAGFSAALDSNQLNLALQYVRVIFENLENLLAEEDEPLPPSAKPARSTVKATADTG